MKRLIVTLVLLFIASTAAAQSGTPEARGREVARELTRRNTGWGDMSAELEMVLRTASGEESRRRMRIRVLEQSDPGRGDASMIIFDSPSDVRGTALLSHAGVNEEDQQYLYLPALRRVRRISSSNMTGAFVGSEFAYEDITGTEADKYDWRLLGEDACAEGQSLRCLRLETRPRYQGSGYARRVVWVDSEHYRIHRVEFFDRRDQRMKTLTYGDYRQYDGRFWRAHRWTMTNHQNGKSTVLVFRSFRFRNGFSDADFSRAALERAR